MKDVQDEAAFYDNRFAKMVVEAIKYRGDERVSVE